MFVLLTLLYYISDDGEYDNDDGEYDEYVNMAFISMILFAQMTNLVTNHYHQNLQLSSAFYADKVMMMIDDDCPIELLLIMVQMMLLLMILMMMIVLMST